MIDELRNVHFDLSGVRPGESYVVLANDGIRWAGEVVAWGNNPNPWVLVCQLNGAYMLVQPEDLRPDIVLAHFSAKPDEITTAVTPSENMLVEAAELVMGQWALESDDPLLAVSGSVFYRLTQCRTDPRKWEMDTVGSRQVSSAFGPGAFVFTQAQGRIVTGLLNRAFRMCFETHRR